MQKTDDWIVGSLTFNKKYVALYLPQKAMNITSDDKDGASVVR